MKVSKLTQGNINNILINLALPIIGSSFLQMTYGLVDMIWIGRLGSDSIAGVGTASFILNFCYAINSLVTTGTGVKVSHSLGEQNVSKTKDYIIVGRLFNTVLSILCMMLIFLFSSHITGFLNLNSTVTELSQVYLYISGAGLFFKFQNFLYTRILNSYGESKLPFKINLIGVSINLILDPILIFGLNMGVAGAALATIIAEFIVMILLFKHSKKFFRLDNIITNKLECFIDIIRLGSPIALQRILFTFFGIIMARIISDWGSNAIAAQKIGLQIESVAYMTIGGMHGAIASFMGQNYGAKLYDRLMKGYQTAFMISLALGLVVTLVFVGFSENLVRVFIQSDSTVTIATNYLKIVGVSQAFMCVEIMSNGAFNGIGRSKIPSLISIVFTGLRIPMAIFLSQESLYGLNGVWITISLTSIVKGIIASSLCFNTINKIYQKGVTNEYHNSYNKETQFR